PRHELTHVSRLAAADGVRTRSAVQALHRRGGEAARGGADEHPGRPARRGRDLLRPRPPRLLREAHGSEGRRRAAGDALVRARRVVFERPWHRLARLTYFDARARNANSSNATFAAASAVCCPGPSY